MKPTKTPKRTLIAFEEWWAKVRERILAEVRPGVESTYDNNTTEVASLEERLQEAFVRGFHIGRYSRRNA